MNQINNKNKILFDIFDELKQFQIKKINITDELKRDIVIELRNNSTDKTGTIFVEGNNYLLILTFNNKIESIIFIGEYTIKEIDKKIFSDKYFFIVKDIQTMIKKYVYRNNTGHNSDFHLFQVEKNFNLDKIREIISNILHNIFINYDENNYDFFELNYQDKEILQTKPENFERKLLLTNEVVGYPKIYTMCGKNLIDEEFKSLIHYESFNKNNILESHKIPIKNNNYIFEYVLD